MELLERLKYDWARGKMIQRLIMVNVFVFIVVNVLLSVVGLWNKDLSTPLADWLTLSTNLKVLLWHPWTLITHGFMHGGFFHILFNMLWLYWVGSILQEYLGSRKILPVYIFGVLAGAVLMVASYNIFPFFADAKATASGLGASAGVMAIIWATVALLPDYRIGLLFLGAVPLIYVAGAFTVLDLISVSGSNAGGHIAHIGGAIMGYWYIKLYQRGTDLSVGFNRVVDQIVTLFTPKKRAKVVQMNPRRSSARKNKASKQTAPITDSESKLNAILDKINESGYASLSKKEKEFLKEQSQT